MTLKSPLFLICLVTMNHVFAQSGDGQGIRNLTKISFLSPGFSYEQKVGRLQTVYARVFLNPSGYYSYSSSLGTNSQLYLDPAITVQYRYYYNASNRSAKGRNIEMNNLNYIAPVFKTIFNAENSQRSVHKTGIVWGLQRNYQKRFSLDLNLGLGYAFAKESHGDGGELIGQKISEFTTIGQLNLGFWLNRRT